MAKAGEVPRKTSLPSEATRKIPCSSLEGFRLDPMSHAFDGRNSHAYGARWRSPVPNNDGSDYDSHGSDTSTEEQHISNTSASSSDSEIHESMFDLENSFGEVDEAEGLENLIEFLHLDESKEVPSPAQNWELIKKFKNLPSIAGDGSLGKLVEHFLKANPESKIVDLDAIPQAVHSIKNWRFENGQRQFLVHWEGWSHEHDSWEMEEIIKSAAKPALSLHISNFFLESCQHEKAWEYFVRYIRTAFSDPRDVDYFVLSRLANEELSIRKDCVLPPKWEGFYRMRMKIAKLLKMEALLDHSKTEFGQLVKFVVARFEAIARYQEWSNEISKKEPKADIDVENLVDCEDPPRNFEYITDHIVSEEVNVQSPKKFCKCRNCNCLDNNCCGRHAWGSGCSVRAYKNGLLTNQCSGVPLFECNSKCACGLACPNRMIQHGTQLKLTIFKTVNRGWGVKTRTFIPKGTFIGEYVGELMTSSEALSRHSVNFTFLFDLTPIKGRPAKYTIDAARFGNFTRFFNHSCDPNMRVMYAYIENSNVDAPRIAFFAKKDIRCGGELTFDYHMQTTDDSGNLSQLECLCGTTKCRKFLF